MSEAAELAKLYSDILAHTKKCSTCRKKLEEIVSCAIHTGDYTVRWSE